MVRAGCPWRNPRVLLTLFLVFAAGFSAGLLTVRVGAVDVTQSAKAAPGWESGKAALLERFKTEVDLTPEQTRQLETVLDDYFTYYHTLQAQLDDVRADGKERILRILNDDQKRRFERMVSGMQDERKLH